MENLFNYATKELSQDAFLMWLMANYNCEEDKELKYASRKFICKLFEINNVDINENDILNAKVYPQENKIDIYAIIDVQNKGKYGVFIEDKTSSFEHNQLVKYNKNIENIKNSDKLDYVLKIFYKSHLIDNEERKRINDAKWKEFSFDEIYNFFIEYKDANNIILSQYANYVINLYLSSFNVEKPKDNNLIAWTSYFENVIKPRIVGICDAWIVENRQYGYTYMCMRPINRGKELMPYLEIRSRDCVNNQFVARILMYDVDYNKHKNGLEEIRNIILEREKNNIFKGNYGEKKNKQVARTIKNKYYAETDNQFIDLCKKVINEYNEIIKFWD